MPTDQHRRHPKPWRRTAQFTPPPIRRLSAPQLRDWRGFVGAARRQRLLSPGRLDVAVQLLQLAGWRGIQRVALAVLAAAADVSIDTVHRALADLEKLGLVKRHHLIERGPDGRTRQVPSAIELLPAPVSDPQNAGERVPVVLKTFFQAWKQARRSTAIAGRMVSKMLLKWSGGPIGGDDEWGAINRDRQLAVLRST